MAAEESSRPVPAMRASDADRERVVAVLQQALSDGRITVDEFGERSAVAYAALTHDELAGLTTDLVPSALQRPFPTTPAEPAREQGSPVVAVFSGARRTGRWRPARRESAVAVFGGVQLDLGDAQLPGPSMQLSAFALFGGIDVVVPEGTRVELSGFSLFGGREAHGGTEYPGAAAFVLHVRAVAVFGGVTIKSRGFRSPRG